MGWAVTFLPSSANFPCRRNRRIESSGQDEGIGRYTSLPRTTKRRITTNLITKTTRAARKIELYESPTSTDLKKKHSFRPVGGAEMGNQGGEDAWQGSSWQIGWSHIPIWEQDRLCNPGIQHQEKKVSKTSGYKNL